MKAVVNYQNNRMYVTSPRNIIKGDRTHFKQQKPTVVVVSETVASDGPKSPLVFIEEAVKVNNRVYQQMLEREMHCPCCQPHLKFAKSYSR